MQLKKRMFIVAIVMLLAVGFMGVMKKCEVCYAKILYEVEAEDENNSFYNDVITYSKSACSGGKYVGWVGYENSFDIQFSNIPEAGSYSMKIYYMSGEKRDLKIYGYAGYDYTYTLPSTGSWNTVGVYEIQIYLQKGYNIVNFSNRNGYAPDIDKITLSTVSGGLGTIKVDNFGKDKTKTYDEISYALPIIHGSLVSKRTSEGYEKLPKKVLISVSGGEQIEWSVGITTKNEVNGKFRGMVMLKEGMNLVRIQCAGCKDNYIRINYAKKKEGPSVKFVYWYSSDSDGSTYVPSTCKNKCNHNVSKEESKKKYTLAALMAQSAYAELMYDAGYGRQTFRIEEPSDYKKTGNLAFDYVDSRTKYENKNAVNSSTNKLFWEHMYDIFETQGIFKKNKTKVFTLIADAEQKYVNGKRMVYLCDAKGGGDFAYESAESFYAFPTTLAEVDAVLHDTTKCYTLGQREEDKSTACEKLTGIIGCMMHELGHALELDDKPESRPDSDGLSNGETWGVYYDLKNGKEICYKNKNDYSVYYQQGKDNKETITCSKAGIMANGFSEVSKVFTCLSANGENTYLDTGNAVCSNGYVEGIKKPEDGGYYFDFYQNDCEMLSDNIFISSSRYRRLEAESYFNNISSRYPVNIIYNNNASGKRMLETLYPTSSVVFKSVYMDKACNKTIKVAYTSNEDGTLRCNVNDNIKTVNYKAATSEGQIRYVYIYNVPFKAGNNNIGFEAMINGGNITVIPNMDYIEVY